MDRLNSLEALVNTATLRLAQITQTKALRKLVELETLPSQTTFRTPIPLRRTQNEAQTPPIPKLPSPIIATMVSRIVEMEEAHHGDRELSRQMIERLAGEDIERVKFSLFRDTTPDGNIRDKVDAFLGTPVESSSPESPFSPGWPSLSTYTRSQPKDTSEEKRQELNKLVNEHLGKNTNT